MFLDIGVGILISIFVSNLFGLVFTSKILLISVVFSLLPDLDFIFYFFYKDKLLAYKHRDKIHNPLIYLLIGGILVYLFFGKIFLVIFLLTSFLHFVHDSFGIGRGIRWLYPFSKTGFGFLYMHSRVLKNGLWKPIFIFDEKGIKDFDEQHGDRDWFNKIYKHFHIFSLFEYFVFLISLIVIYLYVRK